MQLSSKDLDRPTYIDILSDLSNLINKVITDPNSFIEEVPIWQQGLNPPDSNNLQVKTYLNKISPNSAFFTCPNSNKLFKLFYLRTCIYAPGRRVLNGTSTLLYLNTSIHSNSSSYTTASSTATSSHSTSASYLFSLPKTIRTLQIFYSLKIMLNIFLQTSPPKSVISSHLVILNMQIIVSIPYSNPTLFTHFLIFSRKIMITDPPFSSSIQMLNNSPYASPLHSTTTGAQHPTSSRP